MLVGIDAEETTRPMVGIRTFPSEATSVRDARDFVRDCLRETRADVESAVLMTSELATNAVEHAHSDYEVEVRHVDHMIRIEVRNDEPQLLPVASAAETPSSWTDTRGRGLQLLEVLSSRWGIESSDDRKAIW